MTIARSIQVIAYVVCIVCASTQGAPVRSDNSTVDLVSEVQSVAPGDEFAVAFLLRPDPGWHIYWINAGDAGKPATLKWDLPDGFTAGELTFPSPNFVPFGPLMSYGYDEETLFIARVNAPSTVDESIRLAADANWLICDDNICIPERARVELSLPRGDGAIDSVWRSEFAAARAKHPISVPWRATYVSDDEKVLFDLHVPTDLVVDDNVWLFPVAEKFIDHAAPQIFSISNGALRVETLAGPRHSRYDDTALVLKLFDTDSSSGRNQAFWLDATRVNEVDAREFASTFERTPGTSAPHAASAESATSGLFAFMQNLLFAVLGGLILNAMPCVLPILSLKALSIVELSQSSMRSARVSGLVYTLGVLVCFCALAIVMFALRGAGEAVGWAFHLQSPTILVLLTLLMVAVGLNFSGVFELRGTFANFGGVLDRMTAGKGGEFFTGILAVIVASPCTVPFMGAALGYALVQPVIPALGIFLGLALGFALPYLLISFVPAAKNILPKPGVWMDSMRRIMAFPMYATAIWLMWILGGQRGIDALAMLLVAVITLGFVLWTVTRARETSQWRWRVSGILGLVVLLATANVARDDNLVASPQAANPAQAREMEWSVTTVETLIAENKPVFAYFTADWCITCKYNERVALRSQSVLDFFEREGVQVLVGDWTSEDPAITAELERHGRAGVPLYLFYGVGSSIDSPMILPEILTPDLVISRLGDV
ncbi:MAG: protein-disulfide reductase DsbD family protein [Gammaproteobacteria bacterium]|nr:protein-disulfide reductase DsbD family protein [Gammaproteobacteria bacterium]